MTLAVSIAQSGANNVTMRNRIINGAMMIDQRNAGAAVVSNNSGQYPVDRFIVESYGGGVLTSQQSTVVPAGFKNSTLITVTTTDTSLAATDDYEISQKIEGFNVADFNWGTANAQPVTLSFWVRSSVTATYSVGFQNSDASRSYVGTYTINSANTWEQKTITVAGDTSGTWNTGNSTGLFLRWCLATGSNRVASAANTWESANRIAVSATANPIMGTSGATWYITGVQLEAGTTATAFEQRLYGTELALCQRYYWNMVSTGAPYMPFGGVGAALNTGSAAIPFSSPVPMRTAPSVSASTGSALILSNDGIGTVAVPTTGVSMLYVGHPSNYQVGVTTAAGALTANRPYSLFAYNNTTMSVTFSAEL